MASAVTLSAQGSDDDLLAELLSTSRRLQGRGMSAEAIGCLEQAFALELDADGADTARVSTVHRELVLLLNSHAMQLLAEGQNAECHEMLRRGLALADPAENRAPALLPDASALLVLTLNNTACAHRRSGNLANAFKCLKRAIAVGEGSTKGADETSAATRTAPTPMAATHLNMTACLSQQGRHHRALEHAQTAVYHAQEELVRVQLKKTDNSAGVDVVRHASATGTALAGGEGQGVTRDVAHGGIESSGIDESHLTLAMAYHNMAVELEFVGQLQASLQWYAKAEQLASQHRDAQPQMLETFRNSSAGARAKYERRVAAAGSIGAEAPVVRHGVRARGNGARSNAHDSANGALGRHSGHQRSRRRQRQGNALPTRMQDTARGGGVAAARAVAKQHSNPVFTGDGLQIRPGEVAPGHNGTMSSLSANHAATSAAEVGFHHTLDADTSNAVLSGDIGSGQAAMLALAPPQNHVTAVRQQPWPRGRSDVQSQSQHFSRRQAPLRSRRAQRSAITDIKGTVDAGNQRTQNSETNRDRLSGSNSRSSSRRSNTTVRAPILEVPDVAIASEPARGPRLRVTSASHLRSGRNRDNRRGDSADDNKNKMRKSSAQRQPSGSSTNTSMNTGHNSSTARLSKVTSSSRRGYNKVGRSRSHGTCVQGASRTTSKSVLDSVGIADAKVHKLRRRLELEVKRRADAESARDAAMQAGQLAMQREAAARKREKEVRRTLEVSRQELMERKREQEEQQRRQQWQDQEQSQKQRQRPTENEKQQQQQQQQQQQRQQQQQQQKAYRQQSEQRLMQARQEKEDRYPLKTRPEEQNVSPAPSTTSSQNGKQEQHWPASAQHQTPYEQQQWLQPEHHHQRQPPATYSDDGVVDDDDDSGSDSGSFGASIAPAAARVKVPAATRVRGSRPRSAHPTTRIHHELDLVTTSPAGLLATHAPAHTMSGQARQEPDQRSRSIRGKRRPFSAQLKRELPTQSQQHHTKHQMPTQQVQRHEKSVQQPHIQQSQPQSQQQQQQHGGLLAPDGGSYVQIHSNSEGPEYGDFVAGAPLTGDEDGDDEYVAVDIDDSGENVEGVDEDLQRDQREQYEHDGHRPQLAAGSSSACGPGYIADVGTIGVIAESSHNMQHVAIDMERAASSTEQHLNSDTVSEPHVGREQVSAGESEAGPQWRDQANIANGIKRRFPPGSRPLSAHVGGSRDVPHAGVAKNRSPTRARQRPKSARPTTPSAHVAAAASFSSEEGGSEPAEGAQAPDTSTNANEIREDGGEYNVELGTFSFEQQVGRCPPQSYFKSSRQSQSQSHEEEKRLMYLEQFERANREAQEALRFLMGADGAAT